MKNGLVTYLLLFLGINVWATTLPVFRVTDLNTANINLPYHPQKNLDANNCEFYVNSFARIFYSKYSSYTRWIRSFIAVDYNSLVHQQGGQVLNVGMYVRHQGVSNTDDGHGLYLGKEIEPAYFQTDMVVDENVNGATMMTIRRKIKEIAFFIDVKRVDGKIERLWINKGAINFTMESIFANQEIYIEVQGNTTFEYVTQRSPIFAQKYACH